MSPDLCINPDELVSSAYEILVEGQKIPDLAEADVTRIVYRDALDSLDGFRIELANWNTEKRDFTHGDSDLFAPGKKLELKLGYEDPKYAPSTVIKGLITGLSASFSTDKAPKVVVLGVNELQKARGEPKSVVYLKKKDSEIARAIGGKLGFTVKVDSSAMAREPANEYLLQQNVDDIVFLFQRARVNGYDLLLEEDGKTLYFGPTKTLRGQTIVIPFEGTSLDFEAEVSVRDQLAEVEVRAWNPLAAAAKDRLWVAKSKKLGGLFESAYSKRRQILTDHLVSTRGEAQALADGRLLANRQQQLMGRGSLVGVPGLRAGAKIRLQELGKRFSGEYRVTSSRHTLDSREGYTTHFECRREP